MSDYKREVAYRLFAQEFNDSRVHIQGDGERDPSFVVTPTGAKVNRVHIVGTCTSVEPVGESGETWRMRISDPSGIVTAYAGNFQPEQVHQMSELQPPCVVAITGKARHYEPEPGRVLVSLRPEHIATVDEKEQKLWILQTAKLTVERVKAMQNSGTLPAEDPRTIAQDQYGLTEVGIYQDVAQMALECLTTGEIPVHEFQPFQGGEGGMSEDGEPTSSGPTPTFQAPTKTDADESNPEEDALDDQVFQVIEQLQGENGANWDDIVERSAPFCPEEDAVDATINRLMDKGLVYEPMLGVLKTT